ncbi:unnamed protein product [Paramecium pentaurelia]|nr:unnamed protein product [Paramecium pentaurelia]
MLLDLELQHQFNVLFVINIQLQLLLINQVMIHIGLLYCGKVVGHTPYKACS